jgi:hypothetical protein
MEVLAVEVIDYIKFRAFKRNYRLVYMLLMAVCFASLGYGVMKGELAPIVVAGIGMVFALVYDDFSEGRWRYESREMYKEIGGKMNGNKNVQNDTDKDG